VTEKKTESPFKKYPCLIEKPCKICGKLEQVLVERRGQVKNLHYCKGECFEKGKAELSAIRTANRQATMKANMVAEGTRGVYKPRKRNPRDRSADQARAKQDYKPTVWKDKKKVASPTNERLNQEEEYRRMLRRSYNLREETA